MTALKTAYEDHGSLAYGLALRMIGDPARAEDVVEAAFLQLWRGPSFAGDERESMRTRLVTLVGRTALENIRRHHVAAGHTSREAAVGPHYADDRGTWAAGATPSA